MAIWTSIFRVFFAQCIIWWWLLQFYVLRVADRGQQTQTKFYQSVGASYFPTSSNNSFGVDVDNLWLWLSNFFLKIWPILTLEKGKMELKFWPECRRVWHQVIWQKLPETAIGASWLRFTVQKVKIFVIFYAIFSTSLGLLVLEGFPKFLKIFYQVMRSRKGHWS